MSSNNPSNTISRPISSRSTPNVYVSAQSLTVQIPADASTPPSQSSQPSSQHQSESQQSSQQQFLDNRMIHARLGLISRSTCIFAPGSRTSAKYWIKDSYATVNVSPFNEPLTTNLSYSTLQSMIEQRYSHHSAFFRQLALLYYSDPRQSTYLVYGDMKVSVDPVTYKLVHYTHGSHCIFRFHNGSWYEGNVVNNKYVGQGIMTYTNGSYYKGEWLNGKKHGQGAFVEIRTNAIKTFEGKFDEDQLLEGTLTQIGINSPGATVKDVYVGQLKALCPHGKGKLIFSNGSTYEGEWDMGKRHGKGKFITSNVQSVQSAPTPKVLLVYDGDWVQDKQTGTAVLKVYNETNQLCYMYQGSFENGIKTGAGCSVSRYGLVVEGEHENNSANGQCKMLHTKRGWFYEGDVQNGKRHGNGKMYTPEGGVIEGTYDQNILNGHARIVSADGNVFEGNIVNDKAEGMGKHYYTNGLVFEGEFKAGVRIKGLLKFSETEWYCGEFKGGNFHGEGTLSSKEGVYTGTFEAGEAHGTGTFTFVDGTVVSGEFHHGSNAEVSATAIRLNRLRRQAGSVLHRIHEQLNTKPVVKPKTLVQKRGVAQGVANLNAKTRRLMKQFKVPDNVQLVEQLIHRLPKGVKMSDVGKVVRAAMKLINKKE